jgi:hypothetical protein
MGHLKHIYPFQEKILKIDLLAREQLFFFVCSLRDELINNLFYEPVMVPGDK